MKQKPLTGFRKKAIYVLGLHMLSGVRGGQVTQLVKKPDLQSIVGSSLAAD